MLKVSNTRCGAESSLTCQATVEDMIFAIKATVKAISSRWEGYSFSGTIYGVKERRIIREGRRGYSQSKELILCGKP